METRKYLLHGGWPGKDFVESDKVEGKPTSLNIHLLYIPADGHGDHLDFPSKLLKSKGYGTVPKEIELEVRLFLTPSPQRPVSRSFLSKPEQICGGKWLLK